MLPSNSRRTFREGRPTRVARVLSPRQVSCMQAVDDGACCTFRREERHVVQVLVGRVPGRELGGVGVYRSRWYRRSLSDSGSGLVVDVKDNAELLVPLDEVSRILAVKGVDVLHNHLKIRLRDDASARSMAIAGVDVDCCTPRTGSLLTHPEFAELGLWSPGAHTVCRRDCYRCGLNQWVPSCRWCWKLVQARLSRHSQCRCCCKFS